MNSSLISSYYPTIVKTKGVKKSKVADTNHEVEWIPILLAEKPCEYMGIMSNGWWCVGTTNGLKVLDSPKSYLYCIAIMETPFNEVVASLENFFGKDVDVYDVFPCLEIIEHTFNYSKSNFWISLAFAWLKEMESEKRQRVSSSLERIAMTKTVSQKIRHQAKQIINMM